jgi:hypothetical protein
MKSFREYQTTVEPIIAKEGEWVHYDQIDEASSAGRYSIEVNYRTDVEEVLDGFAKVSLGFVSAAMKNLGFHIKQVYEQHPFRILVSTRNWDDGEWIGVVSWHAGRHCFVLSKGFWSRDRKVVKIQNSHQAKGRDASELVKELQNLMHEVKGQPDRHADKMNPVPMKRGPKS